VTCRNLACSNFLNHSDESGFDRDWSDLDIVEGAIRTVLKANPDSELAVVKDGSAAITAFLPTDRAFRRLVTDLTGTTYRNEQRVFNVLRNSDDVDAIESVLLYHVVQGDRVKGDDLIVSQAGTLTTARPHFRVVCL
jgi:uncharacterized surface protein with fasciclin (FAS1) repeats